jgi:hypothetical protein
MSTTNQGIKVTEGNLKEAILFKFLYNRCLFFKLHLTLC